jgi:hypothetical protein
LGLKIFTGSISSLKASFVADAVSGRGVRGDHSGFLFELPKNLTLGPKKHADSMRYLKINCALKKGAKFEIETYNR